MIPREQSLARRGIRRNAAVAIGRDSFHKVATTPLLPRPTGEGNHYYEKVIATRTGATGAKTESVANVTHIFSLRTGTRPGGLAY